MRTLLKGEKICLNCQGRFDTLSFRLRLCPTCIRKDYKRLAPLIEEVHFESRRRFGLPLLPPKDRTGIKCLLCANECQIGKGSSGYCGLRKNENNRLVHLGGRPDWGLLEWYYDPLPTNCVAEWVCPARDEVGHKNLAVFYNACSFNCLFCQNWHYRERISNSGGISSEELAGLVDEETYCICYFGGDPTPQIIHAIVASRIALGQKKGLRICWETNGSMNKRFLEIASGLSLESGGIIKFDLKAWDENLHLSLTGVSNKRTLENFRYIASLVKERPSPPLLVTSTLLIPNYIGPEEVSRIASFIARLDPCIPYSLLAFHPHFYMSDLPFTRREEAERCFAACLEAGLTNVRIGNYHLLS